MTMLWVNSSGEMTVVRSYNNERMFYACNPNVTVSRKPSLRIQVLQAELRGVLLKRRGDDSDDDPGLPHSPATPPNAARLQQELKGQSGKSGGSCSDGSLLSMYSSGTCTDDDIFGPLSKHPSRASLARDQDALELETTAALSHSAAKHRISVRPRRNHGAPRQHRLRTRPQTAPSAAGLPPTVEEESPPATPTTSPLGPATATISPPSRASSDRPCRTPSSSPNRSASIRAPSPDGATSVPRPAPVKRSKSSVADRRMRDISPRKLWGRESATAEPDDRKAESFFSRLFGSRRSGRKKKDGQSLSPEAAADEPAARPPAVPRAHAPRHRATFGGDARSPPSAMHADIIRPMPAPETALRRGPAFLADVRAEVQALASGADRGDDSVTVSPQVLRRHRALAGRQGIESPRVRPKLVGLTSYQQRVAHLQATPSPERETKRRSFSCENISDDGGRRDSCSGMALGSVLNLIKSTTAGEPAAPEPVVLRSKPAPTEDSELLKVFKRRSLKSRDSEEWLTAPVTADADADAALDEKENEKPREETEETIVCASTDGDTGGESRRVSIGRRDSGRRVSQTDEEAASTVGWLKQTVRERREQREQREQQHLRTVGQKEIIIEPEAVVAGRAVTATRSSRVLEMANTFQKLQIT
ncbi:serine/arginine repetitive matrix protein 1-like [Pollicipes pollicipes]|uniref:serine/arginine repetitive matrix protein 1-like n=1 Tax=Pollicipes pollicipes TaxID=41117 RepID=UPI0018851ACE|nr:serine/arginine repetitive matrix protein 1-like [Pollicipes pollicipes]